MLLNGRLNNLSQQLRLIDFYKLLGTLLGKTTLTKIEVIMQHLKMTKKGNNKLIIVIVLQLVILKIKVNNYSGKITQFKEFEKIKQNNNVDKLLNEYIILI